MKNKVLISAPYFQPVVERFRPVFDRNNIELVIPPVRERLGEDELLKLMPDIDGIICGDDRFTEKVLAACVRLKVISKWGTGIDSIDREACQRRGIALRNTCDAFTDAVADSVLGYILCFARRIPWMDKDMKNGVWEKISGAALLEKTLGIIGMGNIGKAVAKRALPFGMKVLGNDIKHVDTDLAVSMVEKDDIYRQADFISLNCDLNPASRYLLNRSVFNKMVRKPVIINTARGPIIKENDLVAALQNGQVSGAGLDVFEEEPLPDGSPLRGMDNVLLAPHNSNSSPMAWEKVHENTVKNLIEELNKYEK